MGISTRADSERHVINIQGRLDFNVRKEFRHAYEDAEKASRYEVDFTHVDYIDSSALGMLLLFRDYALENNSSTSIEITHCRPEIKNILKISNFQKLFTIR